MGRRILKLSQRHYGLMKVMIEQPGLTLAETAALVGYSPSQASRIVNSVPFQECMFRLQSAALEAAMRSVLYPRKGAR